MSSLDVSIQSQIIKLLIDLREQLEVSYQFIAHDLAVVRSISHRVVVMYLGHMVESASMHELYANPMHPYTKALMSEIPYPDPLVERKRTRIILEGEMPSPSAPPSRCVFRTRCPMATKECAEVAPAFRQVGSGHSVACIKV